MREIKFRESNDPPRQTLIEYDGRTYSLVNLVIPPKELNGERAGGRFIDLMHQAYAPYIYELADITDGTVTVLDRFEDEEEAIKYLRGYQPPAQSERSEV